MTTTALTSMQNNTGSVNQWRPCWLAIPNSQAGDPLKIAGSFADRTVQVTGTFGAGGSINIEGSNDDGTTYAILTDTLGNALTFTSAGMKQITELPAWIRPRVTAGDGTTALNVYLFMHKTRD